MQSRDPQAGAGESVYPYPVVMRICVLLLICLGFSQAEAAIEWFVLPDSTAVYRTGGEDSSLLLMANAGEKIAIRGRNNGFAKVQIKRGGKWRVGYIHLSDLDMKEKDEGLSGEWGYGGGAMYSYLHHSGKKFETEDNVKYNTGPTTGLDISPWFAAQNGRTSFWRIILAYRRVAFRSNASTDVSGAPTKSVDLQYAMFSGTLQKVWSPFKTPNFYWGVGLEASKAISATLKIANNPFPVDKSTLPTFFGGHGVAGYQMFLGQSYTLYMEGRVTGFLNQTPMIFGGEAAIGLLYWP